MLGKQRVRELLNDVLRYLESHVLPSVIRYLLTIYLNKNLFTSAATCFEIPLTRESGEVPKPGVVKQQRPLHCAFISQALLPLASKFLSTTR
ncbi:hypothetical protein NTG1052_20025 [Candidatus Nitrotoga sp. 1052]|nr:hypothetical protein NTG1052_20025 [Candidatus Nitrotoga sp. 1052]